MIASLRGTILEKTADGAVVEVNGVGYSVLLSSSTVLLLPPVGENGLLFVEESVAMYGGGVTLYGFLKAEERQIFNVLRSHVPGTGAKKAMELLDKAGKSLPDFHRAILEKDTKVLVSLFGFTSKTAEKMVAALQGKLEALPFLKTPGKAAHAAHVMEETIQGLMSLGYRELAARHAAQSASSALGASARPPDLIREALRHLSGIS